MSPVTRSALATDMAARNVRLAHTGAFMECIEQFLRTTAHKKRTKRAILRFRRVFPNRAAASHQVPPREVTRFCEIGVVLRDVRTRTSRTRATQSIFRRPRMQGQACKS